MSKRYHDVKALDIYRPSELDLQRAGAIPRDACPRRYCWWWHSLAFDWEIPVAQGCRFLSSDVPPTFPGRDQPCQRAVASSPIDHYEPRCPEEDGFEHDRWDQPRREVE